MRRHVVAVGIGLAVTGPAAAQEIGSWVISCPTDNTPCRMRHRTWIIPAAQGRPSAALEVVSSAGQLVPQLAVRGLSLPGVMATAVSVATTVELRFDAGPTLELPCSADADAVVCTPTAPDASVARHLAQARTVTVQVHVGLPGNTQFPLSLPDQVRTLELQRTADALARFRAVAPADDGGSDWRAVVDRLLRAIGFPGGLSDVLRRLMPLSNQPKG